MVDIFFAEIDELVRKINSLKFRQASEDERRSIIGKNLFTQLELSKQRLRKNRGNLDDEEFLVQGYRYLGNAVLLNAFSNNLGDYNFHCENIAFGAFPNNPDKAIEWLELGDFLYELTYKPLIESG